MAFLNATIIRINLLELVNALPRAHGAKLCIVGTAAEMLYVHCTHTHITITCPTPHVSIWFLLFFFFDSSPEAPQECLFFIIVSNMFSLLSFTLSVGITFKLPRHNNFVLRISRVCNSNNNNIILSYRRYTIL